MHIDDTVENPRGSFSRGFVAQHACIVYRGFHLAPQRTRLLDHVGDRSKVVTDAAFAIAWPPAARISSTTASAAEAEAPTPATDPPSRSRQPSLHGAPEEVRARVPGPPRASDNGNTISQINAHGGPLVGRRRQPYVGKPELIRSLATPGDQLFCQSIHPRQQMGFDGSGLSPSSMYDSPSANVFQPRLADGTPVRANDVQ